jgi:hypothetical protein
VGRVNRQESEFIERPRYLPYLYKKGCVLMVIGGNTSAEGQPLAENSECCDRAIGCQNNGTRRTGRVEGISENGDIVLTEHLGADRQNLGEMGRI